MSGRMRVLGAAMLVAVAGGALAGCAHVKALQPVRPDEPTKVRFAAIDVLTDNGIDIRRAPQCQRDERRDITCDGTTTDGTAIHASVPRGSPDALTVSVGPRTLYQGSLSRVLVQAARG